MKMTIKALLKRKQKIFCQKTALWVTAVIWRTPQPLSHTDERLAL